ncbi:hypothetical protein V1524DRAFT_447834 [Lipomyces starkeyi]
MASALPFVKSVWSSFLATSGLEPILIPRLKLLDAKSHRYLSRALTAKCRQNRLQMLHGGTVTSVDLAGSLAVSSRGTYSTSLSTDLNVTYVSSGGKENKCHKLGRSLALTSVEAFKSYKYELFARGTHNTLLRP